MMEPIRLLSPFGGPIPEASLRPSAQPFPAASPPRAEPAEPGDPAEKTDFFGNPLRYPVPLPLRGAGGWRFGR